MNDKQKRALGIGAIGIVGILAYRRLHTARTGRSTLTNGLAQASSPVGSTAPYTPQAPVVVPPGESIYDPNSQALLNTPTAIPTQTVARSAPVYQVNVAPPRTHATTKNTRRPAKRKVTVKHNQRQHRKATK